MLRVSCVAVADPEEVHGTHLSVTAKRQHAVDPRVDRAVACNQQLQQFQLQQLDRGYSYLSCPQQLIKLRPTYADQRPETSDQNPGLTLVCVRKLQHHNNYYSEPDLNDATDATYAPTNTLPYLEPLANIWICHCVGNTRSDPGSNQAI